MMLANVSASRSHCGRTSDDDDLGHLSGRPRHEQGSRKLDGGASRQRRVMDINGRPLGPALSCTASSSRTLRTGRLERLTALGELKIRASAARRRSLGRTGVREDWALVAVVGGAGCGGDWSGSSWSIPIASVVP